MMRPEAAEQSGLGQTPDAAGPLNLSDDERQVLDALSREPIGPDQVCAIAGLAVRPGGGGNLCALEKSRSWRALDRVVILACQLHEYNALVQPAG